MIDTLPPLTFQEIAREVIVDVARNDTALQKIIEIMCKSTPTDPMFGYGDPVRVFAGTELLGEYEGSSCPNGFKVINEGDLWQFDPHQILRNVKIEGAIYPYVVMWDSTYGKIACGEYKGKVVLHQKYGKCIIIKDGTALPSVIPRRKYNWQFQMKEIFIHCGNKDTLRGDNVDWRGSAGCPVVRPVHWKNFIDNFKTNETVKVIIRQDGVEK